jgi:hypothetical protein
MKPYLILIFFLTIYLLVYGFFASFDVCINVLQSIGDVSISYWSGLLIGICIPFIILTVKFGDVLCKNPVGNEKYEITTSAVGEKVTVSTESKNLDYSMISIFLIAIFAFTALLFTLKKETLGDKLYSGLVLAVFIIISIFVYLFYSMTPYFVTANQKDMMKSFAETDLKLYVDSDMEDSKITTNKDVDGKVKNLYMSVFVIIFIFAVCYFILQKNNYLSGWFGSFLNGLFGSCALLILPILWVFNYTIGIRYFYVYPIIIIFMRFIRYAGMIILYAISNSNDKLKDQFSNDFSAEVDDIKNFTPSWGLIGVDLLKTMMNMCGFSNEFSKKIVSNNNVNKNMSQDKYFTSLLFLRILLNGSISENKMGLIYSIIIFIITLIFGSSILAGAGIL